MPRHQVHILPLVLLCHPAPVHPLCSQFHTVIPKAFPNITAFKHPAPILTLLKPNSICSAHAHANADTGQMVCRKKIWKKHCHAVFLQMQGTRDIEKSIGSNPKHQHMRTMQRTDEQSQAPIPSSTKCRMQERRSADLMSLPPGFSSTSSFLPK